MSRISKLFTVFASLAVLLALMVGFAAAQTPEGKEYVVQADDWLSKIAEKEYGDPMAYPTIVEATNAKAVEDTSFIAIDNPDVIEVGQKLWLPVAAAAEAAPAAEAIAATETVTNTEVTTVTETPAMTVTATEVITFTPATIPTETQTGSCWTSAIGPNRPDAFRCMVDNMIYDPCFVADAAPTVVCEADPSTGATGFVLTLTEPLPAPDYGDLAPAPWLIKLADGQVCGLMTGTRPVVDDRAAGYGCPDGSYLFEDFQPGQVWMAEKAMISLNDNGFVVDSTEMVPLQTVWY